MGGKDDLVLTIVFPVSTKLLKELVYWENMVERQRLITDIEATGITWGVGHGVVVERYVRKSAQSDTYDYVASHQWNYSTFTSLAARKGFYGGVRMAVRASRSRIRNYRAQKASNRGGAN